MAVVEPSETRFAYRAPADPIYPEDWRLKPAGDELEEALQQVLAMFARFPHRGSAQLSEHDDDSPDAVLLFPVSPGRLHVVGVSLAERVRLALTGGFHGWKLHELPQTQTSILALKPLLASRFYNLLVRNGFATLEEAAAVPDTGWLELRNVGTKFLHALHLLVHAHDAEALADVARPAPAEAVDDRRTHLEQRLLPATRLRYRDFIHLLAHSRIPFAALDKIADALNAEILPPPDPTVVLLLDTAGEGQLLDYYRQTHHPEPAPE
jgi:hypothetical protein